MGVASTTPQREWTSVGAVVQAEPTVVREFREVFQHHGPLPHAVREALGPPGRRFTSDHQWMVAWLTDRVPRQCQMFARLPNVFNALYPDGLHGEDRRIAEWIRTGILPGSEDIEDPLPPARKRRASASLEPRSIRPDERDQDWWSDEHLIGPLRRFSTDGRLTWFLYVLQPGAKLYHGTSGNVGHADVLSRPNFFGDWTLATHMFAADYHEHHEEGGHVLQFTVTRPLLLLAVDHSETIRTLQQALQRPDDAQLLRRLRTAFPFALEDHDTALSRRFGSSNDVPLFRTFCERFSGGNSLLQVDGTAGRFMVNDGDVWSRAPPPVNRRGVVDEVPPEVFLCNPAACLEARMHVKATPWSPKQS